MKNEQKQGWHMPTCIPFSRAKLARSLQAAGFEKQVINNNTILLLLQADVWKGTGGSIYTGVRSTHFST